MKRVLFMAAALVMCVLAGWKLLRAEELDTIFGRVNEFVKAANYAKALNELEWARKEIEKKHSAKLLSFFPDTLAGFSGAKAEISSVLGISNIERKYQKGAQSVRVSLTGSSGAPGAGLGGLAAFGRMAAMMGGEAGQETIRIAGRTATLSAEQGASGAELTVFLDSGSMLKFEMSGGSDAETLKAMANAVNLDGLDKYLKG